MQSSPQDQDSIHDDPTMPILPPLQSRQLSIITCPKNSCNVSDVLPPHIELGDDGIVHDNEGSDQGVDEEYDGEPQPTRSSRLKSLIDYKILHSKGRK